MAIKYKWLVEQLREIISDSIQKGINKLPTEQELAGRYRVSRQTVRAALAVLEDEREIRRIKGSGAYITGLSSLEDRNIVGILIPDEQQYEYPALINDIRVALAAEGFSCKVYPTHNHVDQERQILQFLLKSPLRALIVEPVKSALPSPNTELYQKLIQRGTSILFLGCAYPQLSQIPVIYEDNLYGAGLLVQSLVEKGHSSIAGIFQMFRSSMVNMNSGSGIEFNIMLAVVLGGFPMTGGDKASLPAAVIGAITATLLSNGLAMWGLDPNIVNGVKGAIFIIMIGLSYDRSAGKLIN